MRSFPLQHKSSQVLAYLAGEKTETRRMLKTQPVMQGGRWTWTGSRRPRSVAERLQFDQHDPSTWHTLTRYGVAGDEMYVREAFWRDQRDPDGRVAYAATPEVYRDRRRTELGASGAGLAYVSVLVSHVFANDDRIEARRVFETSKYWHLRPPMFLPRWAVRIRAIVASVRVERLHDITIAGARAEGIPERASVAAQRGLLDPRDVEGDIWKNATIRDNYINLFYRINANALGIRQRDIDDGVVVKNPWVTVLTFRDITVDRPDERAR